ncbi:MAG: ATP-grasp domain-containing protein, partial [Oscillospiraceae bacterium]|nr:ATP-grasp domain-containing protein [Candidatus Equicaccousia limihippi]
MEKILIVEALSTGVNYIEDIASRNYKPVVLFRNLAPKEAEHNNIAKKYAGVADFYVEEDTYEKTLELVKKINPKVIVTGSESGVELGIKLTEDMGLPGNDSRLIPNFVHKDCMQAALEKAGIRSIKGKIINNVEEAVEFYRAEELDGCVIKPVRGAASVGVRICQNEQELVENLNSMLNTANAFGQSMASMLLQEKIDGVEYIVNTVSYNGVHRLSSVWKYKKETVKGGGKVYDYAITVSELETGCTRLIKYAFDVAKALGYNYGAIHGEYMIDKKGPVLIEVNCRPMGGHMQAGFLDPIEGHHETDNVLDTYLNPQWHYEQAKKPYRNYCTAAFKLLISGAETNVMSMPILSIMRHLKSYYSASIGAAVTGIIPRTVDLDTAAGSLFLRHDDPAVVLHDLEFLRKVEQNYFGIFFDADAVSEDKKPQNMYTVEEIIDKYK